MKKILLIMFLVFCIFALPIQSDATLYEGSISIQNGSLFATDPWGTSENQLYSNLTWKVYSPYHGGPQNQIYWTYEYQFSVYGKDISHLIIEVSETFSIQNLIDGTTVDYELGSFSPNDNGNSNPGLPGSIKGLKWDMSGETTTFNWTIVSDREPMWGDFYAKSGNNDGATYAFNSGFGSDTNAAIDNGNAMDPSDPSKKAWVLVANTKTTIVPEPATMLLLGFGLMGMAFIGRRRFRK